MAVKDIKKYFDEVANQYSDMLAELKDFEKLAEDGLFAPERLEQIKQQIQPLVNNYQTLSYIMFLLNKPVRKEKHKKYEKQNQKMLKTIDKKFTKDGIIQTNQEVINELNNNLSEEEE